MQGLLRILEGASLEALAHIRERCEQLQGALKDADRLDVRIRRVADDVLSGKAQHLWGKTAELAGLVQAAQDADRIVGASSVQVPVAGPLAFEAYDALARKLEAGETWRSGFARFLRSDEQSAVEALGEPATVDGVAATTAHTVRIVAEHLRVLEAIRVAGVVLRDLGIDIELDESRSRAVGTLAFIDRDRVIIDSLVARVRDVESALRDVHPGAPRIASVEQARSIAESARAIAATGTAEASKNWLESIGMYVRGQTAGGASPEGRALARAFHEADFDAINAALDAWDRAVGEQREELELVALQARLTTAAPALAQTLGDNPLSLAWPVRLAHIEDAWAWRRADDWVRRFHERSDDGQLEGARDPHHGRRLHVHPLDRQADLAGVHESPEGGGVRRTVDVRVARDVRLHGERAVFGLDPIRDREEYAALSGILAASEKGRSVISSPDALLSSENPDTRRLGLRAAGRGGRGRSSRSTSSRCSVSASRPSPASAVVDDASGAQRHSAQSGRAFSNLVHMSQ